MRKIAQVFHRTKIFSDPGMAWEKYREEPIYFNFPERITVEITNRCNLKCFMCPRNNIEMETGDMSLSLFKKIIDEAAHFVPICLVPFFRGESLLNPKFFEMISYAVGKGIKPIQIATNAYFLNSQVSKKMLDSGIDFISFSVDTSKAEVYNKIRKHSDFEKVHTNILSFLELKRKKGLTLPEVQISAVKTEVNASHIDAFMDFWKNKVDRIRIYYPHSLDGRLGCMHDSDMASEERMPCLKILTDLVICWNGDVRICNHDWERDILIGSVNDSSIKQIWTNPFYKGLRKRHLDNNLKDINPCNHCSHWQAGYRERYIMGELYA